MYSAMRNALLIICLLATAGPFDSHDVQSGWNLRSCVVI